MPSVLTVAATSLAASHPFFTTYVGPSVTDAAKQRLARVLLFYEVRGRPINTNARTLARFDGECTLWDPRPQFRTAVTAVTDSLTRIAAAPYVAGEAILTNVAAFPAIYWALRFSSGIQWGYMRDIVRRYNGVATSVPVTPADLSTYAALLSAANDGFSNTDRAQLIMKYNLGDLGSDLPRVALVLPPLF